MLCPLLFSLYSHIMLIAGIPANVRIIDIRMSIIENNGIFCNPQTVAS